jgi:hypothetical protein
MVSGQPKDASFSADVGVRDAANAASPRNKLEGDVVAGALAQVKPEASNPKRRSMALVSGRRGFVLL